MKIRNYLSSFEGMKQENKYSRLAILVMAFALLLAIVALTTRNPVVIVQPPGLTEKGTIMVDQTSDSVSESWGLFFADMLGNVTPRTADFVDRKIAGFLSPNISGDVRALIAQQTKTIKDEQVSVQFSATDTFALPADHLVVVTGEYTIRGVKQNESRSTRTFEFGMKTVNYRPVLTALDVFEGPWRPLAERTKQEETARKVAESKQ